MQIVQINPKLKKFTNDKNNIEGQLQNAMMEIKLLREENRLLTSRIAQLEKQQEIYHFLRDQVEFRKHEQDKMGELIKNYQEISTKLNEKMNALHNSQANQIHKESAATTIDLHPKDHQQFEVQMQSHNNFRTSCTRRSNYRSQSVDKQKENHAITPKSRVKIDFCNLFQDKMPIKKKVFL